MFSYFLIADIWQNAITAALWQFVPYSLPLLTTDIRLFNCIIFYSTTLYVNANAKVLTSMCVSWGIGLVNFL
jgi:hypothetical protein